MADNEDTTPATATSVDDLRPQPDHTRGEQADTMQARTDKLDAKTPAKTPIDHAADKLREAAEPVIGLVGQARSAAAPPMRRGIDATRQAVRPAVANAMDTAKARRAQITLAGLGAVLALLVVAGRRRS